MQLHNYTETYVEIQWFNYQKIPYVEKWYSHHTHNISIFRSSFWSDNHLCYLKRSKTFLHFIDYVLCMTTDTYCSNLAVDIVHYSLVTDNYENRAFDCTVRSFFKVYYYIYSKISSISSQFMSCFRCSKTILLNDGPLSNVSQLKRILIFSESETYCLFGVLPSQPGLRVAFLDHGTQLKASKTAGCIVSVRS